MSIGELRATVLPVPDDDEPVMVGDLQTELERRERERMIGQIRTVVVFVALAVLVIALSMVLVVLIVLSEPRYLL
jgi:hypothetical protein